MLELVDAEDEAMRKQNKAKRMNKETQRKIEIAVVSAYIGIAVMGVSNVAHCASEAMSANLRAKMSLANAQVIAAAR